MLVTEVLDYINLNSLEINASTINLYHDDDDLNRLVAHIQYLDAVPDVQIVATYCGETQITHRDIV